MAFLQSLIGRGRPRERAGFSLYAAAVKAAREPYFYAELGVPDTLDGRFDLVALHAALLIERLRAAPDPGPALAQAVFDAMFSDMDVTLREMGVGDLSVGKKVRKMWEAFHGRALAYGPALAAEDETELAVAIRRNVWRKAEAPARSPEILARMAIAAHRALAAQDLAGLARGEARFPAPEGAR